MHSAKNALEHPRTARHVSRGTTYREIPARFVLQIAMSAAQMFHACSAIKATMAVEVGVLHALGPAQPALMEQTASHVRLEPTSTPVPVSSATVAA